MPTRSSLPQVLFLLIKRTVIARSAATWQSPESKEISTPLRPQVRFERNRRRRLLARDVANWLAMTNYYIGVPYEKEKQFT